MVIYGNLKVNNKKVKTPNFICNPRDVISLETKQGFRKIKVTDYFNSLKNNNPLSLVQD